ncbi:MAG TPA: hypothetical protein V6D17_12950 [Candidatus Obscuribacterales bacterium]
MQITITIFVVGMLIACLAYSREKKQFRIPTLMVGTAVMLLAHPASLVIDGIMKTHSGHTISLAVLGIIAGIIVIAAMTALFTNTSPYSESLGECWFFGFFKWDEFAVLWLAGAVILIGSVYMLLTQTGRAWEYGRAYDALRKAERISPRNVEVAPSHTVAAKQVSSATTHHAGRISTAISGQNSRRHPTPAKLPATTKPTN